ncbi:MAG TPA: BrnA antitoxin family protein [Burkholderiaceae bacterium]|nr:BrnA antitoxin family protein [Burkholderiaceae bacterium]
MKKPPAGGYFVWDGKDEDERPLTKQEMEAGIAEARARRGRPAGSTKSVTTIRFDKEVIVAFQATGKGWQTRMNNALKDWLKTHSPG